MPNSNYRRGVRLEYLLMNQLRAKGYKVTRSAGSHGLIDVIAWNKDEVIFYQVKNNRRAYTDDDIAELMEMPRPKGARVYLAERDGGIAEWNMIEC